MTLRQKSLFYPIAALFLAPSLGFSGPVIYVSNISSLAVQSASNKTLAIVGGYYAEADGGGGEFLYDSGLNLPADGGYVLAPSNNVGRWRRINSTSIHVKQFGAKGDSVTNDAPAFNKAISYCQNAGYQTLHIPAGRYRIATLLNPLNSAHKYINVVGEGAAYAKMGGEPGLMGTQLFGEGIPSDFAILWTSGGSGNDNNASIEHISFRSVSETAKVNGIKIRGSCGIKIRDCVFESLNNGIVFSNNLAGSYTEYSVAENCSFESSVNTALLYEMGPNATDPSFHGSGLRNCRINVTGAYSPIQIGVPGTDSDKPINLYNAPLDFQVWTNYPECNQKTIIGINASPASRLITHGTITLEQFGQTPTLAVGSATIYHMGEVSSWGDMNLGRLMRTGVMKTIKDGSQNFMPEPFNAEISTDANNTKLLDLGASGIGELGGLLFVRVYSDNYEYRFILSVIHNGYGLPGNASIMSTLMSVDWKHNFGPPAFSVDSDGQLWISNPNYAANPATVQVHVIPSGGKKENFLR